ncbi:phage baseplate assembly protein [Methylobacterium fujisawaense]|uniref:phage baseplate assembly protein n=1 Tax=Methylobacterium fujisawaense TaxID=107400 RepID=UPI00313BE0B7
MSGVGEIVSLTVAGKALIGWQGVHITRSAEAAAISFSMRATNPAWTEDAKAVRRGGLVEIRATPDEDLGARGGGDLFCTGYVDEYESETGKGANRQVGIAGRSKAGDAIDCSPAKHKTGLVKKKDLLGVAKEFDEFGIGFFTDQVLSKIPMVQHVPGQPFFVTLEREARREALLLMGQPDGRVKITRAGGNRHAGALVEGEAPVKSMKLRLSIKHKRSHIHVRGQKATGTDKDALSQEATEQDDSVGRYRPEVLFNEGSDTSKELNRRAKWQKLRRSGSGISVLVSVASWRDEAGVPWQPGHLIPVRMPSDEIDQDLAISSVTYNQVIGEDEGAGTWADLTLVDPRTLGGGSAGSGSGSGAGNGGGSKSPDLGGGLDDANLDDSLVDYGAYSKRGGA